MTQFTTPFVPIAEALDELRAGRLIVVVDDEDRENEGDLTLAAEKVTPEAINFMARFGRGLICLTLTEERCEELHLRLMSEENTSLYKTAFCESVDARDGVTTGISAADRAVTILKAIDSTTRPADLVRPGHIFPLRARRGGVLVRAGQTEASVDLARLAGLAPAGVICEIMNDDGTMARVPQLTDFCRQHRLKMVTVADLIRFRLRNERTVRRIGETLLPTRYGDFHIVAYESEVDHERHIALVKGNFTEEDAVLVRMQSHCLMGEIFGSTRCDCRDVMEESLRMISRSGRGVFVYLHQTGPGFGLEKIEGRSVISVHQHGHPAEVGLDTHQQRRQTQRTIGVGAQILADLGVRNVSLLTNHPRKVAALEGFDIRILEEVPIPAGAHRLVRRDA